MDPMPRAARRVARGSLIAALGAMGLVLLGPFLARAHMFLAVSPGGAIPVREAAEAFLGPLLPAAATAALFAAGVCVRAHALGSVARTAAIKPAARILPVAAGALTAAGGTAILIANLGLYAMFNIQGADVAPTSEEVQEGVEYGTVLVRAGFILVLLGQVLSLVAFRFGLREAEEPAAAPDGFGAVRGSISALSCLFALLVAVVWLEARAVEAAASPAVGPPRVAVLAAAVSGMLYATMGAGFSLQLLGIAEAIAARLLPGPAPRVAGGGGSP